MNKQVYEDYKYVMQDIYYLYLGAKYTMTEVVENNDIPIKFRLIAERYLYQEEERNVSLESIFYYLADKNINYKIYKQLKTKIKVSILEDKNNLIGGKRRQYVTKMLTLDELMEMTPAVKEQNGVVIQEVAVNKLSMMTF